MVGRRNARRIGARGRITMGGAECHTTNTMQFHLSGSLTFASSCAFPCVARNVSQRTLKQRRKKKLEEGTALLSKDLNTVNERLSAIAQPSWPSTVSSFGVLTTWGVRALAFSSFWFLGFQSFRGLESRKFIVLQVSRYGAFELWRCGVLDL